MPGIRLQPGIIYGPILSRRLGRSLGINLLPTDRKTCSFDCLYCQYGPAKVIDLAKTQIVFPSVNAILQAVKHALMKPRTIEMLTFSGNGEPTLHPDFVEIVHRVFTLRNELRPEAKLAIFSNASRVIDPNIISTLGMFDVPMMKLDAGDVTTFQRLNRPSEGIDFNSLVSSLRKLPNLMIQSLLLDGEISNVHGDAYTAWASLLAELKPKLIHIYSTSRPTAYTGVKSVNAHRLKAITDELEERYQLNVMAFD